MKKLLIIVITIISPYWVHAKQILAEPYLNANVYTPGVDSRTYKDEFVRNIYGSPFVLDLFQPAFFTRFDKTYLMRYDAFHEKMQLKMPGDTIINLTPHLDYKVAKDSKMTSYLPNLDYRVSITSKDKIYVPVVYPDNIQNLSSFGILVWSNNNGVQLIKREKKVVKGYSTYSFTKVIEKYYIVNTEKESIQLLPENKSELYEVFFDEASQAKAKKEKLKPYKHEDDLIKLFETYYKS